MVFGSDSHRGSIPTHSGILFLADCFGEVVGKVGQVRHGSREVGPRLCAGTATSSLRDGGRPAKPWLPSPTLETAHGHIERVGIFDVRQVSGTGDVNQLASANLSAERFAAAAAGVTASYSPTSTESRHRDRLQPGVAIGPIAEGGQCARRHPRPDCFAAIDLHAGLTTSGFAVCVCSLNTFGNMPSKKPQRVPFSFTNRDGFGAVGLRLAVVHPGSAGVGQNQPREQVRVLAGQRQRDVTAHRQPAHNGLRNLAPRQELRDHIGGAFDAEIGRRGDSPKPGRSGAMTRVASASPASCGSHMVRSSGNACRSSSALPLPTSS